MFAIAGQPYSLTCTVQVVQYLAVIPSVTWLAPDGSPLQNVNGITLGQQARNGNITTLPFAIDPLAQSHAGNYTCQACISIDKAGIEGHCGHVVAEMTLLGKYKLAMCNYVVLFLLLLLLLLLLSTFHSPLVPGRVRNLGSIRISDQSVSLQWREPENTNGAIVNYTVQVQKYQPVSGSSRELELVTIGPEFNQNIFTTMLTLSSDGRFMINISEDLGETNKSVIYGHISTSLVAISLFFSFAVNSKPPLVIYLLTEPLVPYLVTVVAVNLAGPGEQETRNFFTREEGICMINYL